MSSIIAHPWNLNLIVEVYKEWVMFHVVSLRFHFKGEILFRFLLDLSKINEFAERTACFMFQATFAEELEIIHNRNSMLHSTIDVSIQVFKFLLHLTRINVNFVIFIEKNLHLSSIFSRYIVKILLVDIGRMTRYWLYYKTSNLLDICLKRIFCRHWQVIASREYLGSSWQ